MLKILQARLQQYVNRELPDIQAGFGKDRGTRDQIANICRNILSKKQESSRKTSTSALLTTPKPLTVDHNKLWKILQEMGVADHLTCLLRNLYAGQEATVRTGHGTRDWFQIGKGVHQVHIVTLLIQLICGDHHEKCWAGLSTSWNQDCQKKYQ